MTISIQEVDCQDENLMNKKNLSLLLGSLALGLLFDFFFFEKPLGLSYPLYITALYFFLFWNINRNIEKKPTLKLDFNLLLGISIMSLSLTYFFFSNPIFAVLNFFMIPILLVTHTLLLTSNNWHKWFEALFLADLLYGFTYRPLKHFLKPFLLITSKARSSASLSKYSVAGKVLVGFIVTIPLLIVIVPLLASADDVFRYFIEQIPNLFRDFNPSRWIAQSLVVFIITCLVFSYLSSLFHPKTVSADKLANLKTISPGTFLDPITVTTLLVLIDTLYVVFIAIQFSYLFGSLTDGLPTNFTYAQYARKGFFELVAVTLINLVILLGNLNFIKASGRKIDKVVRLLNTILVVSTFIMLLSAHFRMSLYEEAYGFTYLRILTHAFMGYLFVLFSLSLVKIWRQSVPLLKSFLIVSIVAYTILNYINIDKIIVKNNIERYNQGAPIDISYLTTLSYDALPQLVDFMNGTTDSTLENNLEEGLKSKEEYLAKTRPWQSFNISEYNAMKSLTQNLHPTHRDQIDVLKPVPAIKE